MVSAVLLSFLVSLSVHLALGAQKQKNGESAAMEFAATKGLSSESPAHKLKEVVHKSAATNSETAKAGGHVSLAIDPHGEVKKVENTEQPPIEAHDDSETPPSFLQEQAKKSVEIQETSQSTRTDVAPPVVAVESPVREAVREVPEVTVPLPKHLPSSGSGVRHEEPALPGPKISPEEELPEIPTSISRILEGLSGGTGTALEPTGDKSLDREIRFRMQAQDTAVLLLLMLIYIIILIFMYSMVYRMSRSDSPVCFYCNPSYHRLCTESNELDSFLNIFNKRPLENKPQIRVAGFNVSPDGGNGWQAGIQNAVSGAQTAWRGKTYDTVFYYALDLEEWTSQVGEISDKDQATIKEFLNTRNTLATLVINKEPVWDDFAEVATNIKAKIRESGFEGPVDVTLTPPDKVIVYQNDHWANFMYNETVKVMTLLSIVGGLLYVPYMWLRGARSKRVVTSKFQVSIDVSSYWKLIEQHISHRGFAVPEDPSGWPPATPPIRPREEVNVDHSDLAAQLMNTTSQ